MHQCKLIAYHKRITSQPIAATRPKYNPELCPRPSPVHHHHAKNPTKLWLVHLHGTQAVLLNEVLHFQVSGQWTNCTARRGMNCVTLEKVHTGACLGMISMLEGGNASSRLGGGPIPLLGSSPSATEGSPLLVATWTSQPWQQRTSSILSEYIR